MEREIDYEVFTPYWDALKRALVRVNAHGGGIGETGRGFLFTNGGVHTPSEASNIDISDHHAAFSIRWTTNHLWDRTPHALFTNGFDDEFIREEYPCRMPDREEGETLRSQTLRWIDLINSCMVVVINEVNKGEALAPHLQNILTPVLQQLFPVNLPVTSPEMPLDGGSLIYDVSRNFLLVGINAEPLVTPF